jgi:hypothetical protein
MHRHVVGHEPETSLDKLVNAVPGLTALTTLDISLPYSWDDHSFYGTKLSVIHAGWPIFCGQFNYSKPRCATGRNSPRLTVPYYASPVGEIFYRPPHSSNLRTKRTHPKIVITLSYRPRPNTWIIEIRHTGEPKHIFNIEQPTAHALSQPPGYHPPLFQLEVDVPRRLPPFPRDSSIATSTSHLQFCGAILFL